MQTDDKGRPERCAACNPSTGEAILIVRGERGYHPYGGDPDRFNKLHGITRAQVEAMLFGSMFGFETPAADPANWAHLEEVVGHA